MMIASELKLARADIKALKVTDAYSLHRVVYDLYEDVRTEAEKSSSMPSGILYADKGGNHQSRQILILSTREPKQPVYGQLKSKHIPELFLQHDRYIFEVILNPSKRDKNTGKINVLRDKGEITQWFINKASQTYGFSVNLQNLQVNNNGVHSFEKKTHLVTLGSATLKGELEVIDRARFEKSFKQGIGRGRAFGFGLLQIVPQSNFFNL